MNRLMEKKIQQFCKIKRGYWSFWLFLFLILFSIFAEVFVNSRALAVHYEGGWYFPTYGAIYSGKTFGLEYDYETNYRDLKVKFEYEGQGNRVFMPLVPYNPFETDLLEDVFPPYAPSMDAQHYLGTDKAGRDIVARLLYGFRIAISFSLLLLFCNYLVGITLGCLMGYWGGWFDLIFQRLIEIWSNVPTLYLIMIVASIIVPNFWLLIIIMVIFGWMPMTWYMRTVTYRERSREYVLAARTIGASTSRIVFSHVLPNAVSVIITFVPFSVTAGITMLTALDYLGFGLPPPTPSWGELLREGKDNVEAPWIVGSVVVSLVAILMMITFIGEAIREAFDPKRFIRYE